MKFSKSVAPNKPFFMYFAPGAMHAPHQVRSEWREPYDGKFDMGWDAYREEVYQRQLDMGIIPEGTQLTPRPDWVDPWDSLNDTQKEVYTTLMENYAGYMAFADHEVGRLLAAVKELPDADNTLIIYIVGDNGASSEGGPERDLQRDRLAERHRDAARGSHPASGRRRRARDRAALSDGLGLGRQRAVPVGEAGRLAPRRHPQPDGGQLAGADRTG